MKQDVVRHKNIVPVDLVKALKNLVRRPPDRTSRTDTVCESCPLGSFSPDGVNCTAWTTCSATQVEKEAGSVLRDAECGAAPSRLLLFWAAALLPMLTVLILVIRESSAPPAGHAPE
ncbi:hypothetical protein EYF80_064877 [Liparis tanakae]|uniref:TNFR-Cys domain-containing protein n=1 Tax=Liparis tanakae TaxID=230148 RepID=A0A4Z2E7U0_9TELE|nr:hypothetical protein EYF80_064877 [Liparis tanakae]